MDFGVANLKLLLLIIIGYYVCHKTICMSIINHL